MENTFDNEVGSSKKFTLDNDETVEVEVNEKPLSPVLNPNKLSRKLIYGRLHRHRKSRAKLISKFNEPVCVHEGISQNTFLFGNETSSTRQKDSSNLEHRVKQILDIESRRSEFFDIMARDDKITEKHTAVESFNFKKPTSPCSSKSKFGKVSCISTVPLHAADSKNLTHSFPVLPKLKIDITANTGFKTAAGRNISISESVVKKHSKVFEDILNSSQDVVKKSMLTLEKLRNKQNEDFKKDKNIEGSKNNKNNTNFNAHSKEVIHKLFENEHFDTFNSTSHTSDKCDSGTNNFETDSNNEFSLSQGMNQTEISNEQLVSAAENVESLGDFISNEISNELDNASNVSLNNTTVEYEFNELEKILQLSPCDLQRKLNKKEDCKNTDTNVMEACDSESLKEEYDTNTTVVKTLNEVNERCENILDVLVSASSNLQDVTTVSTTSDDEFYVGVDQNDLNLSQENTDKINSTVKCVENSIELLKLESCGFKNSEIQCSHDCVNTSKKTVEDYEKKLYTLFESHIIKKMQKCKSIFSINSTSEVDRQKVILEKTKEIVQQCKLKLQSELEALEDHTTTRKLSTGSNGRFCSKKDVNKKNMDSEKNGSVNNHVNNKRLNDNSTTSPKKRLRTGGDDLPVLGCLTTNISRKRFPIEEDTVDKPSLTTEWCKTNFNFPFEQSWQKGHEVDAGVNKNFEIAKQSKIADSDININYDKICIETNGQMEIAVEGSRNLHIDINMRKSIKSEHSIKIDVDIKKDSRKNVSVSNKDLVIKSVESDTETFISRSCVSPKEQKDKLLHTENKNKNEPIVSKVVGFSTASGKSIDISKEALKKAKDRFSKDVKIETKDEENFNLDILSKNTDFMMAGGKNIEVSKEAMKNATLMFTENKSFSEHCLLKDNTHKIVDGADSLNKNLGFVMASGKDIKLSEETLKNAQKMFHDEINLKIVNNSVSCENKNIFQTVSGTDKNFGFTTAGGKDIKVSEKGLKIARQIFDTDKISFKNDSNEDSLIVFESKDNAVTKSKTNDHFSIDNVAQPKASSRCKKRLGVSSCKIIDIPVEKLEKAKSIFEGCRETKYCDSSTPLKNECLKKSYSNISTPKRLDSSNIIYSSTPVRNVMSSTSTTPFISENTSHVSFKSLENPNITPIKAEKSANLKDNKVDIVIQKITDGNIAIWQSNLDKSYENLKRQLEIVAEKKKMLDLQMQLLRNPSVDYTRRRLGTLSFKKQQPNRLSLRQFVDGARPRTLINHSNVYITPQNASLVHFDCSKIEETKNVPFIKTSDGAIIIPNCENFVGLAEITVALKTTPGVETRLIPNGWISNHYKWIVWKLARLEYMFPLKFKGCLTLENVMLQLKYRYDREIDRVERPALRLILEKDASPQRRMILCVSDIIKIGDKCFELELTDSWYSIRTTIDRPLCQQILKSCIKVGTKLIMYKAELLNCEGCYPLEAPENVRLKIMYNSTRHAVWDAKLGFQKYSGPLPISLKTIHYEGGNIGSLKIYIARVYPFQYMEQYDGFRTYRNEKAEQLRAQEWDNITRQKREELQNKLYQNEFEEYLMKNKAVKSNLNYSKSDISKITCPQALYELLQSTNDPDRVRETLTSSQLSSVVQYESNLLAKRNFDISSKLNEQINEMQLSKRKVTPILQLLVLDATEYSEKGIILKIWNPTSEHEHMLKEETVFSVYNLTPNAKGDLHTNSKTHFKQESSIMHYQIMTRKVLKIEMTLQKFCRTYFDEFDTIGVVIKTSIDNNHSQHLWLSDATERLLLISISEGPNKIALLENLKKGQCVAASNLKLRKPHNLYGQAVANFCTIISSYPKHKVLQNELRSFNEQIPDVLSSLLKNCEHKVAKHELDWKNSYTKSSTSAESDLGDLTSDQSTMMQTKLDATDIWLSLIDTDQFTS